MILALGFKNLSENIHSFCVCLVFVVTSFLSICILLCICSSLSCKIQNNFRTIDLGFLSSLLQKGAKKSVKVAFIKIHFYFLEPCILNVTDMDSNNLTLKWRREELIFLHGDLIEFECKQGYGFLQTAIPSPGRTQCDRGRLKFPKCVIQGKAIYFYYVFN